MDFRLTDEQLQIQQMVRDFAESEIKPHLAEWDEAQHFPVDTFKRAGELGMLGVTMPEEYGGAGLSYIDYVNVIEELGCHRQRLRPQRGRAQLPRQRPHLSGRQRATEEEVAPQAHLGRVDRRLGSHRAGFRQ